MQLSYLFRRAGTLRAVCTVRQGTPPRICRPLAAQSGSPFAGPQFCNSRPVTEVTPVTSVLIVDDEAPVRELLSRWVQSLNLHPYTAANADEAVAALNSRHCDLAIVDIMMPGKNGLWLAD